MPPAVRAAVRTPRRPTRLAHAELGAPPASPPPPPQPPRHRPFRHAKLSGGFTAGLALKIAQDDDGTIPIGQAAQFLIQQGLQVTPEILFRYGWFGHLGHLPLPPLPPGGCRS